MLAFFVSVHLGYGRWIGLRGRYYTSSDRLGFNRHEARVVLTVSFDPSDPAVRAPPDPPAE